MRKTPPKMDDQIFEIEVDLFKRHKFDVDQSKRRGPDAKVAGQAAKSLRDLLLHWEGSQLTGLRPELVAQALLGALRRHPEDAAVQYWSCSALHFLCDKFAELRATLQRDASVYATVRAAAKVEPSLEKLFNSWYKKELCVWLQLGGDGTVEGWDKTVRSCSHGRISVLQRPFFSLIVVILCLDANCIRIYTFVASSCLT